MKRNLIFSFIIISVLKAQTSIISGFVSDSSSGEALIGANVFLRETGQGMATDINGYYIIPSISSGTYILKVMMIGYAISDNIINIIFINRYFRKLFTRN